MQDYLVRLQSEPHTSYRCQRAANSLDIDVEKKLTHELRVTADVEGDFAVGLIVGASGSGKTTLARQIYGDQFEAPVIDLSRPIIDQFPDAWTYDECANTLTSMGLSSVVCWIRPAVTLSNGQRARAEAALRLSREDKVAPVVIDEWTSVVDRTVAKAMSHCVAKHARRYSRRVVLLSCHYDVIEWLAPDWVIDCNRAQFEDRRRLRCDRLERLRFDVREVDRGAWRYFSKYHYLSDRLPSGDIKTFGLFLGSEQIGFQCFANYVPHRAGTVRQMHSNRTVIHPDYCGFGLGIKLIDATSSIMSARGYDVRAKFSSIPIYKAFVGNSNWRQTEARVMHRAISGAGIGRKTGYRLSVNTFSFKWVGSSAQEDRSLPAQIDPPR